MSDGGYDPDFVKNVNSVKLIREQIIPPMDPNPVKQARLRVENTLGRAKEAWLTIRQLEDVCKCRREDFFGLMNNLNEWVCYLKDMEDGE